MINMACGSKDLLTDPLGSLVKEIGAGASLGSLFQFYPYGTKSIPSPLTTNPFRFVAAYGYNTDSADRDYVRARELMKKLGRWMQTDPYWPHEPAFDYVGCSPLSSVDPSGKQGIQLDTNPDSMWSQPPFVKANNCHFYACDRMRPGPGIRDWPNPGGSGCMNCTDDATSDSCKCKKLMECIAKDGFMQPRPRGKKCPKGTFTVIAFVKPTPPCDYHFARSLPDGRWCDKHGDFPVCDPFDDPYEHIRRLGYTVVCQHYCVQEKQR